MKRYDMGDAWAYLMQQRDDGEYVEYEDYAKLKAKNERLRVEKERLKDFAQWIYDHTADTCNLGVVIKNTDAASIRAKAEQALKEKCMVKRYNPDDWCGGKYERCGPIEASDGEFVLYEDYEVLKAKNERLKEGIRLYIEFARQEEFTPIEIMQKIEKWLDIKVIGEGMLISAIRRKFEQALKEN